MPSLVGLLFAGCATAPPQNPNNICSIFQEKDDWFEAAAAAERKWGVPIPVQMAIIYQESGYNARIKPPRKRFLWLIPTVRPSSAYGYTQAIDSTWEAYEDEAGGWGADRDEFEDAVDFVSWYVNRSSITAGIPKDDAYRHYLAYHEGPTGYKRGTYRGKNWLINVAKRVQGNANRYSSQLAGCREDLEDGGWFF